MVGMPVRGGVAVRRVVTAPDVAAVHAEAQVHPTSADAKTVLATVARRNDLDDGGEVHTGPRHCPSFNHVVRPTPRLEPPPSVADALLQRRMGVSPGGGEGGELMRLGRDVRDAPRMHLDANLDIV